MNLIPINFNTMNNLIPLNQMARPMTMPNTVNVNQQQPQMMNMNNINGPTPAFQPIQQNNVPNPVNQVWRSPNENNNMNNQSHKNNNSAVLQHSSSREPADSYNGDSYNGESYPQSNSWCGNYGVSPRDVYKKSTPGSAVWFGTKNVFDQTEGLLEPPSQSGYHNDQRPSAAASEAHEQDDGHFYPTSTKLTKQHFIEIK